MTQKKWEVHKLGGTSVGDAGCYIRVPQVVGLNVDKKEGLFVKDRLTTTIILNYKICTLHTLHSRIHTDKTSNTPLIS